MARQNITGKRIREARKEARPPITQVELVARVQTLDVPMDQSKLSLIESGERAVTDTELKAFAEALHVEIGWFFQKGKD